MSVQEARKYRRDHGLRATEKRISIGLIGQQEFVLEAGLLSCSSP